MSWNVQQQTDEERGDVSPAGAAWSRARSHAGLGQRRAAAVRAGRPAPCGAPPARGRDCGHPHGSEPAGRGCDPGGSSELRPRSGWARCPTAGARPGASSPSPRSGARQPLPAVPALPACARGAWLGMNVARGGQCPGERHTGRVPCHGRAGEAAGMERGGGGRAPGRRVPSQLGPARAAGAGMARPGTARGCGAAGPPAVTPLSVRQNLGAAAPHSSTEGSGRETPSQRKQESPSGTLSEQGAGREINSGVSGCPGPGEGRRGRGTPLCPTCPQHGVAAGSGRRGIIAFLRRVRSSFVTGKSTSEAPPGRQGERGPCPPSPDGNGICPRGRRLTPGIVGPLS